MSETCKHCGKALEETSRFCPYCGTPTEENLKQQSVKLLNQLRNLPNPTQIETGSLIDERYEILAREADSDYLTVFRITDLQDHRQKRLKIIPPLLYQNAEAMDFLIQEFKSKLWLNSPNIIKIYSIQSSGVFKYILMEYFKGRTLREIKHAAPQKRLPEKLVLDLGLQIASALEYAHNYAVIAGYLRPESILINKDGLLKIDNFGIREALYNTLNLHLNLSGLRSSIYMSPEQLTGISSNIQSDVYVFGLLLYELLTGHPPFFSGDIHFQILNSRVPDIDGISAELNLLIQKCMAKDPDKRFNQFSEIQSALESLKKEQAIKEAAAPEDTEQEEPNHAAISMAYESEPFWNRFYGRILKIPINYWYGVGLGIVVIIIILLIVFNPWAGKSDNTQAVSDTSLFNKPADQKPEFVRQDFMTRATDAINAGKFFQAESILLNGLTRYPDDSSMMTLAEKNRKLKQRYLMEEPFSIEILNGAGVSGIAHQLGQFLNARDYRVINAENYRIGDTLKWDVPESFIINRLGYNIRIERLAGLLGIRKTEMDTSDQPASAADVSIVLGRDYESLNGLP